MKSPVTIAAERAGTHKLAITRLRAASTLTARDRPLPGEGDARRSSTARAARSSTGARRTGASSSTGCVGLPGRLPLHRISGTDLWYLVARTARARGSNTSSRWTAAGLSRRGNDPLNPHRSHSPIGSSSVCFARGYVTPRWTEFDPDARTRRPWSTSPCRRRALRRETRRAGVPARPIPEHRRAIRCWWSTTASDFLQFAAFSTVFDNLIHRLDMAETVVAFMRSGRSAWPSTRTSAPHARWVTHELIPALEGAFPLRATRAGRCCWARASVGSRRSSAAVREPGHRSAHCVLMSGSFVFTDIGNDHQGGPAFDPVVALRERLPGPARVCCRSDLAELRGIRAADRPEPIAWSPVFEGDGMTVRVRRGAGRAQLGQLA